MSWSRRHAVVGTARMEESVSAAILPDVQEIRPGPLPVPSGSATLGCRLLGNRRRRGTRWPALRIGRPLHRRAFRGLADLFDHPPGLDRYADHRADTAEYRTCYDRGPVHRGGRQSTVSLSLSLSFLPKEFPGDILFRKILARGSLVFDNCDATDIRKIGRAKRSV